MQDNNHLSPSFHASGERRQPVSLIVQLMQAMASMHHVDEVLLWLSTAMVYHLVLSVVQFWALQLDRTGRLHTRLRAIASQHAALPQLVSANQQVVFVIDRLLQEQRSVISLPVERVFSPGQASLLIQYSLRYWSCFLLKHDALLPSARTEAETQIAPTPLVMVASFFSQVPLSKEQERAINFLLEQTLRMLVSRDFLIAPGPAATATSGEQLEKFTPFLTFADIILQRSQDVEALQAANPFANATIITDKNARRLYAAIDGRKTMSELMKSTSLGRKEGIEALRYLLQEQKIQVLTLDEKHIDVYQFIDSLT